MIKSSAPKAFSVALTGRRLLKIVPTGIPSPIFSAIRNLPVGVFMLPSFVPKPNREVEIEYAPSFFSPNFNVSRCLLTEMWIFDCALFFIAEWQ